MCHFFSCRHATQRPKLVRWQKTFAQMCLASSAGRWSGRCPSRWRRRWATPLLIAQTCRARSSILWGMDECENRKVMKMLQVCSEIPRQQARQVPKEVRSSIVFQTGESHINLWPWLISQYDFRFAQNKSARSALMCPARRRSRYLKGHYLVLVIIIVIAIIMMIIIVVAIVMTIMIIVANKQQIIIVVPICNLQWSGVQRDSSPSCPRGV